MIRVKKVWLAQESITCEAINPEYLNLNEQELEEYFKKHPMPKDNAYSQDELMFDLLNSSGTYILPDDIKTETASYVEDLLNELVE